VIIRKRDGERAECAPEGVIIVRLAGTRAGREYQRANAKMIAKARANRSIRATMTATQRGESVGDNGRLRAGHDINHTRQNGGV
jgi:hypothetical protein